MARADDAEVPTASSFVLPRDFLFGVATAGFQIEGGYNGPGQPANNWADWERRAKVERSGTALSFWDRYEEHLDAVVGLGCNSFRMSIEWARVEPEEGRFDQSAWDRYRAILEACHRRRLVPLVTLHHFTHPQWLGTDLWLRPDAPQRFAAWARRVALELGDLCTQWVTLNELNILAVQSYLFGAFPPGRRGDLRSALRAIDNLLTAHVLGYQALRSVDPGAVIATNNFSLSIYELDGLLLDMLASKGLEIATRDLHDWLQARRDSHEKRFPPPTGASGQVERFLRRLAMRRIPLERGLPRATSAVEASESDRLLDVSQIDYYNTLAASHLRIPGHRTAGGINWEPARMLWDDPPDPAGMRRQVEAAADRGLPVWVVENGMCNRVRHGKSFPRLDGWDRPRYLRENISAIVEVAAAGVDVGGYWHWTLADNYEWGSYEPRFGIFGVDRYNGAKWSDLDSMGYDAANAYREIIAGLRERRKDVLWS